MISTSESHCTKGSSVNSTTETAKPHAERRLKQSRFPLAREGGVSFRAQHCFLTRDAKAKGSQDVRIQRAESPDFQAARLTAASWFYIANDVDVPLRKESSFCKTTSHTSHLLQRTLACTASPRPHHPNTRPSHAELP